MENQLKTLAEIQSTKTYLLMYVDEMDFESESEEKGLFILQHFQTVLMDEFPEVQSLSAKVFLDTISQEHESRLEELGYRVLEI